MKFKRDLSKLGPPTFTVAVVAWRALIVSASMISLFWFFLIAKYKQATPKTPTPAINGTR